MSAVFIVDAFADRPFTGNQAAVCLAEEALSSELCQKIAAEFNLSETAYPRPIDSNNFLDASRFSLRWFTPTNEVSLCGHATLASAHVILNEIGNKNEQLTFETLTAGDLSVARGKADHSLTMNFPQFSLTAYSLNCSSSRYKLDKFQQQNDCPDGVGQLVKEISCDQRVDCVLLAPVPLKLIVVLTSTTKREDFEALRPPTDKLLSIDPNGELVRGIVLTVEGNAENGYLDRNGRAYDFASRYFSPWNGIKEDPATGSAHCCLAPFWSSVLQKKHLYARQCYPNRGADFSMDILDNGRLNLTGQAVTIVKGEISF